MISVCLAAYNGSAHIEAQLRSILASPLVTEVLVSDDGSTDTTRQIVQSIDDPRLQLLPGPGAGLISNFEFLLARASGQYIFLADQDDVWLPEKVEVMLAHLHHADLVVSDCQVTDAALRPLHPSFFALRNSGPGLRHNLTRNSYLGCCMALRRDLLRHALPFPPDLPMHDWWLGLVAELFGRVVFEPRPLVLYRRHGHNASSTAEPSKAHKWRQLQWRLLMLRALFQRWWSSSAHQELGHGP